jgi:hypothetical protein
MTTLLIASAILLGYIILGFITVYLAGVSDKLNRRDNHYRDSKIILFILSPIYLIILVVCLIPKGVINRTLDKIENMLDKIYWKGNNE